MAYNAQLLNGMVIFVEVVNTGGFTLAAQSSGHSTSYISKEINKLESRLGVRLMHRTTRSLSLTPEGEIYFQQCQQIIGDAEQAEETLNGRQSEPKGTLRISCPTSFGNSRMQSIFSRFLTQYPLVNLELDLNNRKVDMVSEGFDVLIRGSAQLDDSTFISRKVFSSYGVVIASPDYLKRQGTPQTLADLSQHSIISYSHLKQPNIWSLKDASGQSHQVQLTSRVLSNSSEMELSLCLAGHGITRMPRFNLGDEIETGKLVELLSDYQRQEINLYLIYPSRKYVSSKVRRFIDFVVAELSQH
ncbi:LysR family transcriptional regulator [Moritella sp. 24]|uniref:LysR family transcriptional regulator n=1 Tax=Moritella sp. 24 TaxID=2746230 RepID=UPI001BA527C1|nr:LysR family transcriptional regulator [Moritella sp. 24]QUM76840.1 LysR family transcriptional regulator [Moritella sp. 24]